MFNSTTFLDKKINLQVAILLSVVLMFLSDIVNTLLEKAGFNLAYYSFSIYVRLAVGIFFIFLILRRNKGKKIFSIILSLISFYLIGFSSSMLFTGEPASLLVISRNIILVVKLAFIFLCSGVVKEYFYEYDFQLRLFKIFEIIIWVCSLAVLVGFIFKIELFSSYGLGRRSGFKGLFPAQNEAAIFFILATFYYLNKFFLISSKNINFVGLILAISAGLLTGTKACLIVIPISIICYFIIYSNIRFFVKKASVLIVAVVLIGIFSLFNIDFLMEQWNSSVAYFRDQYLLMKDTGKGQFHIWLQLLLSSRNIKAQHFFTEIPAKWTFLNFLFGGWSLATFSIEMDPIDIFSLVGLMGFGVYYANYIKLLGIGVKAKFFQNFLVIMLLIISFTGGHLSFSAINAMYLSILLLQINLINKYIPNY